MKTREEITKEFSPSDIEKLGWIRFPKGTEVQVDVLNPVSERFGDQCYYIKQEQGFNSNLYWYLSFTPNNYGVTLWWKSETGYENVKGHLRLNIESIEELQTIMKQTGIK